MQIHHDCIMVVMVDVLVVGPGRSIHKPDNTFPDVANFLNYFFKEKNLEPSTIAGYRITIADCFT